jgi:hypothetical protein
MEDKNRASAESRGTSSEQYEKETFMTHGDTHEHENVFSYQIKV